MKAKRSEIREKAVDVGIILLGSALYALGFRLFIEPQTLILGGATGVATLLYNQLGLPVGLGIVLVNLPLLAWGVAERGVRMLLRTGLGIAVTSVTVDALWWLSGPSVSAAEAAVFGGALCGVGIGLLYLRGYTTGGSDLAASLLYPHAPVLSIGRWILLFDSAVVLVSVLIDRSTTHLLYSVLLNIAFALSFDGLVDGSRRGKMVLIITSRHAQMEREIQERLGRGVTELLGIGAHEGAARRILLCAISRGELYRLRAIVQRCDREAFMIVTETSEVVGRGFSAVEG